jgi:Spy/CpxP family protein refolding chaperone
MSRHLVWLVLAISVIFNLGFAAAYLNARTAPPADVSEPVAPADIDPAGADATPDVPAADPDAGGLESEPRAGQRADGGRRGRGGPDGRGGRDGRDGRLALVGRMLGLDEDQQAYFRGLHEGMATDEAIFSVAIGALREGLVEAYEADTPDTEAVRSLHEREAELLRQRRLARSERLEAFMAVLRPEQLERFRSMVEDQQRRDRPEARERIAEFDSNGDGQLDEVEIDALRARVTERIREQTDTMIERQRAMRERFDADGDGRLDREERAAAWRWQITQRYDADGDGSLSPEEQATADAERDAIRRRMERGARGDRRGDRRDGAGPGRGPGPGPGPNPETNPETDPETDPKTGPDAGPKTGPETGPEAGPAAEAEPERAPSSSEGVFRSPEGGLPLRIEPDRRV